MRLKIKRAYEPPERSDGYRVLVDRLWPRGKSKEDLRIDLWLRDIAPSDNLRKWYSHDPKRWGEFKAHYYEELDGSGTDALYMLLAVLKKGTVTLVYSTREEKYNNAVALKEYIEKHLRSAETLNKYIEKHLRKVPKAA